MARRDVGRPSPTQCRLDGYLCDPLGDVAPAGAVDVCRHGVLWGVSAAGPRPLSPWRRPFAFAHAQRVMTQRVAEATSSAMRRHPAFLAGKDEADAARHARIDAHMDDVHRRLFGEGVSDA